jgi:hypothetical protein
MIIVKMDIYAIYKRVTLVPRLPVEYLYNLRHFDYDDLGISYLIETLLVLDMYKVGMNFTRVYDICMMVESDDVLYSEYKQKGVKILKKSLKQMLSAYTELEKVIDYNVDEMIYNIQNFILQTDYSFIVL